MRSLASAACSLQKARTTASSPTAPILTRITAIYPLQASAPGFRAKVRRNDLVQAARHHCSATEPRDSVRPGLMFHIWQKEIETVCCTVSLKNDIAIPD